MINKGLFTSNTDLRATPINFFEKLNNEFWFTLDPCATHENHKCERYFTKEDDGLKQNRDNEIVFCNPPYWREIKKRVEKWAKSRGGGDSHVITSENRYQPISWLHISQIRNKIYQMKIEVWRW